MLNPWISTFGRHQAVRLPGDANVADSGAVDGHQCSAASAEPTSGQSLGRVASNRCSHCLARTLLPTWQGRLEGKWAGGPGGREVPGPLRPDMSGICKGWCLKSNQTPYIFIIFLSLRIECTSWHLLTLVVFFLHWTFCSGRWFSERFFAYPNFEDIRPM